MTYRPTSSAETAATFRALYERRQRARRELVVRMTKPEVSVVREVMLSKIGGYQAKWPAAIFDAVRDDYGSCSRGRLDAVLRSLVDAGEVARTEDGYVRARVAAR